MSDIVISVENLGKMYRIGHQRQSGEGLRHVLHDKLMAPLRWLTVPRSVLPAQIPLLEDFWAIRDINFEVRSGEVIGIIGRNGAGKSTLLKVLSRVTEPTAGRVRLKGRVASLLEVGTGFHPELTGRENIFVNGAILGMSRKEIKNKFDEIVAFAEVEQFLDTPVKRYSSGMYVRLAFSVAAHLEPEILIIDEVLAVGDLVFQKKCIGKMRNVARGGRTVLFVSHNMQTVMGLTERAILLQSGQIVANGRSAEVVDQYLRRQGTNASVYEKETTGVRPEITRVRVNTSDPGNVHRFGKPMTIDVEITTPEAVPNSAISFHIMTGGSQPVVHVLNLDAEVPMLRSPGTHKLTCRFPKLRLYPGHYYLTFYFGASEPRRKFEAPEQICPFEVAALDEVRDFYWYPNNASYVEDVQWSSKQFQNPTVAQPSEERPLTMKP